MNVNWPLYIYEAGELAIFMISACLVTALLFDPSSPGFHLVPNPVAERLLMGIAMGVTAILIIHSPMGKRSGAHFNPAITLTYLRLGKIAIRDAVFYVLFQFIGGVFGVAVAALILGRTIADPSVDYAVTVPGKYGTAAAFGAELFMAALLMGVVLWTSNRPALAPYTPPPPPQLLRGNPDRSVHPLLRARIGVQHQSGPNGGIGRFRGRVDRRVALLDRARAGHDDFGGDLRPGLRRGFHPVREVASRPEVPMPVSVSFPTPSPPG